MNIFVYADMESKINRCRKKANEYFSMLIYLLIIVALIFTVVGIILVRPVSILLGANETMLESCVTYGKTLLIFLISQKITKTVKFSNFNKTIDAQKIFLRRQTNLLQITLSVLIKNFGAIKRQETK